MAQVIELAEYEKKSVRAAKPTVADEKLAERLSAGGDAEARLDVRWLTNGRVEVKASSWVGVVRFSELEIRVAPKLVGGNLRVLRMIEYSDSVSLLSHLPHERSLPADGSDLFTLIVMALVSETQILMRDGLIRDYRAMDDTLTVMRGRLRLRDQFLRQYGAFHRLECQFDEYDGDIAENQLLAAALAAAATRVRGIRLQTDVRVLADRVSAICTPNSQSAEWYSQRIHYGRRNGRYRSAHELSLLILRGLALSDLHNAAYQGVTAFMINMNYLFERFVTRLVANSLIEGELRVSAQQSFRAVVINESTNQTYSTIRPDLVITDTQSGREVPVDIKYKLYESNKVAAGDVYQLFTYAYALGEQASQRIAGVIYASTKSVTGPALRIQPMTGVTDARIRAAGLDVTATLDALDDQSSGNVHALVRKMIVDIMDI